MTTGPDLTGKRTRCTWTCGLVALALAWCAPARADVLPPPDTAREDVAGALLIGVNAGVATYLATSLALDRRGTGRGGLGIAVGAVSITLAAAGETSFAPGVAIAGAASLVLGLVHVVGANDRGSPPDPDFDLSRRPTVSPLVTTADGRHAAVGLCVGAAF